MILLWMDFNHIGYKFCASRLHHCLFEALIHCHAPFKCVCPQHPPQKSLFSVCQEITYYQFLSHWTLKSSAVEWIVRVSLLSGTTDLLRTCYFPLGLPQWLRGSLWNVCFLCHILWFPFNQGRHDVEGFAFLEFVLKGRGCQSRGMKTYFKPGETLWKVRETDRREFLTAFLQHALECTRLWCRNNWRIWTWSQRSTRGAAGHLGFVFKYFAVFSYCGPKKWTDSPISQVSQ